MIAPLEVDILQCHQVIHNTFRMGSSVKDISYDMQMVNSQFINNFRQVLDKRLRNTALQNGTDNRIIIVCLVLFVL